MAALTAAQRRTLESIGTALLPVLSPQEGDDPRLFALDATALKLPAAMEETIAALGVDRQAELRRLLGLLGTPVLPLLLTGRARRFSALSQEEAERFLLALANSRLPLLRTGFQALKRLATFLFYSLLDAGGEEPDLAGDRLHARAPIADKPAGKPAGPAADAGPRAGHLRLRRLRDRLGSGGGRW